VDGGFRVEAFQVGSPPPQETPAAEIFLPKKFRYL
jgi:hypothetical protein